MPSRFRNSLSCSLALTLVLPGGCGGYCTRDNPSSRSERSNFSEWHENRLFPAGKNDGQHILRIVQRNVFGEEDARRINGARSPDAGLLAAGGNRDPLHEVTAKDGYFLFWG